METIEGGYGEGSPGGWTMHGGGTQASQSRLLKLTAVNSA